MNESEYHGFVFSFSEDEFQNLNDAVKKRECFDKYSIQDVKNLEQIFKKDISCPNCNSKKTIKYGKAKNKGQRYLCKGCGTTFLGNDSTVLSYTKLPIYKIVKMIKLMVYNSPLKLISQICEISDNTVFYGKGKFSKQSKILMINLIFLI